MPADIQVHLVEEGDPYRFDVEVKEGGAKTRHSVTMNRSDYDRLVGDDTSPERFVQAAFQFLLDREPKESILSSFDVTVISRYFPEFDQKIGSYL